jgi:hypothetical protein
MKTVITPQRTELLRRAAGLGPLLRTDAPSSEYQRRPGIEILESALMRRAQFMPIASATIRVYEAGFHIRRTAELEAADLLAGASGGTSSQLDVPIMRPTRTSNYTGGWPAGCPQHPIPLSSCEEQ